MLFKAHNRSHLAIWARSSRRLVGLMAAISFAALAWPAADALAAQPPVGLGTAGSFAVLAGSAVTNTGPSVLNGDLGVSPGTAVTGFPPGLVNGATYAANAAAGQAQSDLTTAYNDAAGRTPPLTVSGDLGGLTLTPGVYRSGSSLGLTGKLTLNGEGDANAVFIFKAGSSLTTASASDITLINGAQACNVFWQVGSSATLGTSSVFTGDILAYTSISINHGVTVHGRALARNGAVTLIDDTITPSTCTTTTGPGSGTGSGSGSTGGATTGTALLTTIPRSVATKVGRYGTSRCVRGRFRVAVTGLSIRRVVFSLGDRVIARRSKSPFRATVRAVGKIRVVTARVTFRGPARAATLHFRFRACAAATLSAAPVKPIGFTG
jgi:hypothetical protein